MTFWPLLRIEECRNLTVTAELAHGVVADGPWPLLLDGVLESAARRELLGESYGDGRDLTDEQQQWLRTPDADRARDSGARPGWLADADAQTRRPRLPLATYGWHRPKLAAQWVWLASCATWSTTEADLRYWHARFGHADAERVCGPLLPAMVYETHGRYRSYRVPLAVTLAGVLTWRVCGDAQLLLELCRRVDQLGKKHSQGEGRVLGWHVTDDGPPDPAWALWGADGRIARPVPARAATLLGVPDAATVSIDAVRPPYWRPAPTTEGSFRRERRDVLAPTTRRP
jgi:hypothetical protein